jgi:hypothetical protein
VSFEPTYIHAGIAFAVFLSPLAGMAWSTWRRSKRNEEKLDVLLRSLGIDPENPRYDLERPPRVADGGESDRGE